MAPVKRGRSADATNASSAASAEGAPSSPVPQAKRLRHESSRLPATLGLFAGPRWIGARLAALARGVAAWWTGTAETPPPQPALASPHSDTETESAAAATESESESEAGAGGDSGAAATPAAGCTYATPQLTDRELDWRTGGDPSPCSPGPDESCPPLFVSPFVPSPADAAASAASSSAAAAHTSAGCPVVPPVLDGGRTVVLMRHGVRLDRDGWDTVDAAAWPARSERPWDPPLSADAAHLSLIGESAVKLQKYGIRRVVSSPYERCLATAAAAAHALGLGEVEVHCGLGEWYHAVKRCCTAAGRPPPSPVPASEEAVRAVLGGHGVALAGWVPWEVAESDEHRFTARVHDAMRDVLRSAPESSVLCVTHGDVANRYLPEADFIEEYSYITLQECGFVACREAGPFEVRQEKDDVLEHHRAEMLM